MQDQYQHDPGCSRERKQAVNARSESIINAARFNTRIRSVRYITDRCWRTFVHGRFDWGFSMHRLAGRLFVAAALLCAAFTSARAEVRVALVIGNGAYQNVPRLVNPVNDANDVAAALQRDGFNTILATDLNKDQMDEATIKFAKAARTADVAMFYYSGHALQFAGVNYLAPVDAKLTDEADLRRMVRVDEIVSDLQQARNLRILVLDSCRNNPLADELRRSIGTTRALSLQRGLAKMDTPLGMVVSYSTQAGTEADDGNGRNSPYTAAFLKEIEKQDEIGTIFRRISSDVYEATDHRQLPELSLSLIGEFYLRGKVELHLGATAPQKAPDTSKDDFAAAQSIDTLGAWEAFLANHPDGYYAILAREREKEVRSRAKQQDQVIASAADSNDQSKVDAGDVREKYKDWKITGDVWSVQKALSVALSSDERRIITSSFALINPLIEVRDSNTGKTIGAWQSGAEALAVSPDDSRLALGLGDGGIEIRDATSGVRQQIFNSEVARLSSQPLAVKGLSFSADSSRLAVLSADLINTEVSLWDVRTGALLKKYRHLRDTEGRIGVALLPDYRCVEFFNPGARANVVIRDCETGNMIASFSTANDAAKVAVSSDGSTFALWNVHDRAVEIRSLSSGSLLSSFSAEQNIGALAISADGRSVLTGDADGTLSLWESSSGARIRSWLPLKGSMVLIRNDGSFWANPSDLARLRLKRGKDEILLPRDFKEAFLRDRPYASRQ